MHGNYNTTKQDVLTASPLLQSIHKTLLRLPLVIIVFSLQIPVTAQGMSRYKAALIKKLDKISARSLFPMPGDAAKFALNIYSTPASKEWPNRKWYDYLPPCPDKLSDINEEEWVFDEDVQLIKFYHPGGISFRSRRRYCVPDDVDQENTSNIIDKKTFPKWHGQQACYHNGILITSPSDPGAGTPDFVGGYFVGHSNVDLGNASKVIDLTTGWLKSSHFYDDVAPWEILGFRTYNKFWKPQGGSTDAFNVLVGRTEHGFNAFNSPSPFVDGLHPKPEGQKLESKGWRDTMLDVKQGDVIAFEARGEVVWGELGEKCDADGDPNTEGKTLLREIFAPRPFPDERIGTLMGAVVPNDNLPSPNDMPGFKVGRKLTYTVATDGRLWLGINDADTYNNKGYFDVLVHKLPAGEAR